jgi:predicted peptidase
MIGRYDSSDTRSPPDFAAMMNAHTARSPRSNALRYLLYTPEGYDEATDTCFPLVVFLHGGGESGSDLERVTDHGLPHRIQEGESFPFILLAPQNPGESKFWDDYAVMALIDEVCAHNRVDPKRIYLTGMSRGGDGAWRLAMNNPDRFAALSIVCGATAPSVYADWIRKTPIWVFHGAEDPVVPLSVPETMVAALRAVGADVRFTVYPEVGHDAWEKAYGDSEHLDWLLSHSL